MEPKAKTQIVTKFKIKKKKCDITKKLMFWQVSTNYNFTPRQPRNSLRAAFCNLAMFLSNRGKTKLVELPNVKKKKKLKQMVSQSFQHPTFNIFLCYFLGDLKIQERFSLGLCFHTLPGFKTLISSFFFLLSSQLFSPGPIGILIHPTSKVTFNVRKGDVC